MPRRIYTYQPGRGLEALNLIASIGALLQGIAVLIFVINVVRSLRSGEAAGNDPWDAWTLEWSTTSPPPEYNFAERAGGAQPPPAVGPETSRRPGLEVRMKALALRCHPSLEKVRVRSRPPHQPHPHCRSAWSERSRDAAASVSSRLILTESAFFSIFVVAYIFYLGKSLTGPYPKDVLSPPILNTICLLSSSITIVLAIRALRAGSMRGVCDSGGSSPSRSASSS